MPVPKNGKGYTKKSGGGTNSRFSFQHGKNKAGTSSIVSLVSREKRAVNSNHNSQQPGKNRHERINRRKSVTQVNHEQRAVIPGNSQLPGKCSQTEEVGNSFDREVVDRYAARKGAERAFFNELFKDEPKLLDEYNKRILKTPDGYIYWDFLPTLNKKYGRNYCEALNYVQSKIATAQIDRTDDLHDLRNLAVGIMNERKESQASHLKVCKLWEKIVGTIDEKQNMIKCLETRDSDAKVDEVRPVPNAQVQYSKRIPVAEVDENVHEVGRRLPSAQVQESKRIPVAKVDEIKVHEVGRRVLDTQVHEVGRQLPSAQVQKSKRVRDAKVGEGQRRSSKNSFCCCS